MRMDVDSFALLTERLTPLIERSNTNMRESISPGERLAVTMRYLATGRPTGLCIKPSHRF